MNDHETKPRIIFDDGTSCAVGAGIVIGRDPSVTDGVSPVALADPSVSKSHVAVRAVGDVVEVSDLGSTNGTIVVIDAVPRVLPPGQWAILPLGARVEIGDRSFGLLSPPPPSLIQVPTYDPAPPIPATIAPPPPVAPTIAGGAPAWSSGTPVVPEPPRVPVSGWASSPPGACHACGASVQPDDRFCENCGRPVPQAALTSAPPPAPFQPPDNGVPSAGVPVDIATDSRPQRGRRIRPAAIAAAVVVVVALAGLYVVVGRLSDDSSGSAGPLSLPGDGEAWSTTVDGYATGSVEIGSKVYVAVGDDGPGIVVLDSSSGDELDSWNLDGDGFSGSEGDGRSAVMWTFGDIIVAQIYESSESDFDQFLVALDSDDGAELWRENLDGRSVVAQDGRLYVVEYDGDTEFERMDVEDGSSLGRASAASVFIAGGHVIAREADSVEILDPETLDRVGEPVEVDEDASSLTYDGRNLLVVVGDELSALDSDGTEIWTYASSVLDEDSYSSVTAIGDVVIVNGADGSEAVRRDGDTAERLWKESGTAGLAITDDGPLVQLYDDGDIVLLDPESGDEVVSVDEPDSVDFVGNGYLLYEGFDWDCTVESVEAVDYDGEVLWSENADGACVDVFDGAVLLSDADESDTELTYLR